MFCAADPRAGKEFIEKASADETLSIEGNGQNKLDFTYIDDLIQGTTLVVEKDEAQNETFNLTYGEAQSIAKMAEILENHFLISCRILCRYRNC